MNRAIDRRGWLALALSVALLLFAFSARAHHGWGWASAEVSELSGVITAVRLGNPHGEITLDVNGERWVVEVGQPWRNERAGLSDALLGVGRSVTAHGHRSTRPGERLLKANWLMIDGQRHVLYPERQ